MEIEVIAKSKEKVYKIVDITLDEYKKMKRKSGYTYTPYDVGKSCYPKAEIIKYKK